MIDNTGGHKQRRFKCSVVNNVEQGGNGSQLCAHTQQQCNQAQVTDR